MQFVPEDVRRRQVQRLMATVKVVRAEPVDQPQAPSVAANTINLLIKFGLEVMLTLLVAYQALGLHPSEGKRAVDDLLARGMVQLHRLPRKGRGGQPTVVEVLPAGLDELRKRGITPAEKKLRRGGFRHDIYARYIEQWAREAGYRCYFERTLGDKAFDVVIEDSSGALRGIEICLSGTAKLTASQLLKGAGVAGVQQVVAACEGQRFLSSVLAEVRSQDTDGRCGGKVVGQLLAEYVR